MIAMDLPPNLQERVVCSIVAAVKYEVPANVLLAIAEKEGGKPGEKSKNSNGTYDFGVMQFNTVYLTDLQAHGITADDVLAPGCYPYDLAAWRLRTHLQKDSGDLWTRAANYHSKTPKYNTIYQADLKQKATQWAYWLNVHFATYPVNQPVPSKAFVKSRVQAQSKPALQAQQNPVYFQNAAARVLEATFGHNRRGIHHA